jgi:hypothetical protein
MKTNLAVSPTDRLRQRSQHHHTLQQIERENNGKLNASNDDSFCLISAALQQWCSAAASQREGQAAASLSSTSSSSSSACAVELFRRDCSRNRSSAVSVLRAHEWEFWTAALSAVTALLEHEDGHQQGSTSGAVHIQEEPTAGVTPKRRRKRTAELARWQAVWDWCTAPATAATPTMMAPRNSEVPPASSDATTAPPVWFLQALLSNMAISISTAYDGAGGAGLHQLSSTPPYLLLLLVNQLQWLLQRIAFVTTTRTNEPPSPPALDLVGPLIDAQPSMTLPQLRSEGDKAMTSETVEEASEGAHHHHLACVFVPRLETLALHLIGTATSSMTDDLLCFALALSRNLNTVTSSTDRNGGTRKALPPIGPFLGRVKAQLLGLSETVRQWMSHKTFLALSCAVVDDSLAPVLQFALQDSAAMLLLMSPEANGDDRKAETASALQEWMGMLVRECDAVVLALQQPMAVVVEGLGGGGTAAASLSSPRCCVDVQQWCPTLTTLCRLVAAAIPR